VQSDGQKGFSLAGRSLFIAIPCYDGKVNVTIAFNIARLVQELPQYGVACQMAHLSGCSVVSKARNTLAAEFLRSGCTDLLWIDSDIEFNPDDIVRLMAWASEKDIVGGVIPTRKPESPYIATLLEDEDGRFKLENGLVEAERLGTAFMLIRDYVLKTMVEKHPEWDYEDNDGVTQHALFDFTLKNRQYVGEDYTFCDRARADGFRIFVDPAIKLDHFGSYKYKGDFGKDVVYPALVHNDSKATKVAA
jgi:hypothetical protein